jgi:hypothetical protein
VSLYSLTLDLEDIKRKEDNLSDSGKTVVGMDQLGSRCLSLSGETHLPAVADMIALPFFSPNAELNWRP